MESVDKFGRGYSSGGSGGGGHSDGLRGPRGEGFVLDRYGHYLVTGKRIKQLADPEDGQDAVNKRWLESRIKSIEEKLSAYVKDRSDLFQSCGSAVITSDKAYETSQAVKSSVERLASRVQAISDRESTLKEHAGRIDSLTGKTDRGTGSGAGESKQ